CVGQPHRPCTARLLKGHGGLCRAAGAFSLARRPIKLKIRPARDLVMGSRGGLRTRTDVGGRTRVCRGSRAAVSSAAAVYFTE
ncbi:MAG: hypothetical protein ABW250_16710, partial [Pyrinomonadaceae bacterium]